MILGIPWIELAVGIGAALIAGLVRGFSGFGSAMILTPALSVLYGPPIAVPISLALELLVTVPLLPGSIRLVEWRRIGLLCLAAIAGVPLGTWLLFSLPPAIMRIAISAVILVAVLGSTVETAGLGGLMAFSFLAGSFGNTLVGGVAKMSRG